MFLILLTMFLILLFDTTLIFRRLYFTLLSLLLLGTQGCIQFLYSNCYYYIISLLQSGTITVADPDRVPCCPELSQILQNKVIVHYIQVKVS